MMMVLIMTRIMESKEREDAKGVIEAAAIMDQMPITGAQNITKAEIIIH